MKKSVRISAFATAVLMTLSVMLTGCGTKETSKGQENQTTASQAQSTQKEKLEPVKLSWYFPWTQQGDQEKVWGEVNKYLGEKLNATIEFKPEDWGTWNDKMSMVLASGDNWDIVFSCNWQRGANYATSVSKGAFLPLDDLLAKYAPTLSAYPKKYWDCAKINGKVYGVINVQTFTNQWGLYYNKSIAEKAQVMDAMNNLKKVEDLDAVFEAVKKADPNLYIAGDVSQIDGTKYFQEGYYDILTAEKIYAKNDGGKLKAVNVYEEQNIVDYLKMKAEWYKKGYMKKDQITMQSWDPVRSAGKVFLTAGMIKPGGDVEFSNRYGQQHLVKPIGTALLNANGPTSSMESINAKCKNPERAMMIFELMNSDKKLFNLMVFGMEGTHYNKIDSNTVESPKDSKYNPSCAWEFGNTFNAFVMKGQPADVWEQTKKLNETAKDNPLSGFTFNSEAVKTEIANIDAVLAKYDQMIINGADIDSLLKQCQDGMKKAGMEKVLAEVQKQLDAFKGTK